MALDGAKFICLSDSAATDVSETTPAAAGNSDTASMPENIIEAKGRKFTVGYYMNCDYVLEDPRAIGVHCEIQCDAFGRVTIHNNSETYPISVNDQIISLKRPLLDGSRIKILDRYFLWRFPKSLEAPTAICNKAGEDLASDDTSPTPQKLVGVPVQAPNSCPDLKPHRKMDKRFTVHNFAYCINSDEEGNTSSELESMNESENITPDVAGKVNTQKNSDETNNAGKVFPKKPLPENNSSQDSTKDKAIVETVGTKRRSVTPELQPSEPTIASTPFSKFEDTPKINLINCTQNKGNVSNEKKKRLLTLCQQSDIVITSFSPRETGVHIEKSFTSILKPSAICTLATTSTTPKSVYSTPKSMISNLSGDGSRDFIDFTTSATSKKSVRPLARNSSMHLIDLTTPNKLAPASPRPWTTKFNRTLPSHVKLLTTPLSSSKIEEGSERKKDIGMKLKTPIVETSFNKARATPQSTGSVISVDGSTESSPAVIEISTEDSETPSTSSSSLTCKSVISKTPVRGVGHKPLTSTPLRTPQSLMKRAILTSAKKQVNTSMRILVNKGTPFRQTPSTSTKLELNTAAGSSPLTCKSPISIGSPGSVAAAQRRNINTSKRLSISTAGITSTLTCEATSSTPHTSILQTRKIPASTSRLGVKRTSPLRGVRKSFGGTTLSSHISKTRRSVLPPRKHSPTAIATKLVSKARKSYVATTTSNTPIASRGRSLVAAAVSVKDERINPTTVSSVTPINKKVIDTKAENEEKDTTSLNRLNDSNELSRTFTVDDSLEEVQEQSVNENVANTSSSQKHDLNEIVSPEKLSPVASGGSTASDVPVNVLEDNSGDVEVLDTNKTTEHISEIFAEVVEANEKPENNESIAGSVASILDLQQDNDGSFEASVSDSVPDQHADKSPNTPLNIPVTNVGESSDQVIETLDAGEIIDSDLKEPVDGKNTGRQQISSLSSEFLDAEIESNEKSSNDSVAGKQTTEAPNTTQNSTCEIRDKEKEKILKDEMDKTLHVDEIIGNALVEPTENTATESVDATPTTSYVLDADIESKPSGESQGTAELLQEIEYVLNKSDELQQQFEKDAHTTDNLNAKFAGKTEETDTEVIFTEDKGKTSVEKGISELENKGTISPFASGLGEIPTYSDAAEAEDTISLESNILPTTSEIALSDLETGSIDTEITTITSMATISESDISAVECRSICKPILSEATVIDQPESMVDIKNKSNITISSDDKIGEDKISKPEDTIDSTKLELHIISESEANTKPGTSVTNLRIVTSISENYEGKTDSAADYKDTESKRRSEAIEIPIDFQASMEEKKTEMLVKSPVAKAQSNELETTEFIKNISEIYKTKDSLTETKCAEEIVRETLSTETSTVASEQIPIENQNIKDEVKAGNAKVPEPHTPNLSDTLNTPKPVETTPKASTSAAAARAALGDNSAIAKTMLKTSHLLKIKADTPQKTSESSTFTPRRSARRRASANPVLTPTPTRSVTPTLKTAIDTDINDTPRRTTRRRASASAEITYTPQRFTRRRSSLSLDNEEAVTMALTPIKRSGLRAKRPIESPIAEDMGAIIEEESKESLVESADVPQDQIESVKKSETEVIETTTDVLSIPEVIEEGICEEVSTKRQKIEERIEDIVSKNVDEETENEKYPTEQVETITTEDVQSAETSIEEKILSMPEPQIQVKKVDDDKSRIIGDVQKELLPGSEALATENPKKTGDVLDQSDYEYGKELGDVEVTVADEPKSPGRQYKADKLPHTLIDSPKTPVMIGMREMLTTPKADENTPKLMGVRDLLRTPKTTIATTTTELVDDEQRIIGLTELMETPKAVVFDENVAVEEEEMPATSLKSRSEFIGMRELLKTPKHISTPYYSGIREMLRTPKACSTPHLGGVEELMQTPKRTKLIEEDNKNEELDQFFKTPRSKNVMIPADPASAVLEPSSGSSEDIMIATTEYDLHSSNQRQLEDIYKTPVSRLTNTEIDEDGEKNESKIEIVKDASLVGKIGEGELIVPETPAPNVENPTETTITKQNLSAEDAFDEMVGLRTTLDETPPRKVYVRNQQTIKAAEAALSPFSATDFISDLPKTDIQEWVDNLGQGSQSEEEEQEVTVSDSMLDATKATHDPIAASIGGISSISVNQDTTEKMLADMSGVSSMADPLLPSASKSAKSSHTVVMAEDETLRPDTPAETEISGINLLDQTNESVFSEALIVSDSESVQDTNENFLEEIRINEEAVESVELVTDDPNKTQEDFPVMLVDSSCSESEEDTKAGNSNTGNIKPAERNASLETTDQGQDAEVIEIDDSSTTTSAELTAQSASKDTAVSKSNDIHEEFSNFQAHKSIAGHHMRASTPNRSSKARLTQLTQDRRQSMGAEQNITTVSIDLTLEKSRLSKEKGDQGRQVIATVVEVDEEPTDETLPLDNLSKKDEKPVETHENSDKSTILLSEFKNFCAHKTIVGRGMRASTPDQVNESLKKRISQGRRLTLGAEQHSSGVTIDFVEEKLKLDQLKQQPMLLEEMDKTFNSSSAEAMSVAVPKNDVLVENTTGDLVVDDVDTVVEGDIAEDIVESTQPTMLKENPLKLVENTANISNEVRHLSSKADIDEDEDVQIIEDIAKSSNTSVVESEEKAKERNINTDTSSYEDISIKASTSVDIISTNIAKDEHKSSHNENASEIEVGISSKPLKDENMTINDDDSIEIIESEAENSVVDKGAKQVGQKIDSETKNVEDITTENSTNEENVSAANEISSGTSGHCVSDHTEISSTTNIVDNTDLQLIVNIADSSMKVESPEDKIVEDISTKESTKEEIENKTETKDSSPDEITARMLKIDKTASTTGNEFNESDIFDLTEDLPKDLPVINTTQGVILDLTEEDEDDSNECVTIEDKLQEKKSAEEDIAEPSTESPLNTNIINNKLEGQITSTVESVDPTTKVTAEVTDDKLEGLPTESGIVEEIGGIITDNLSASTELKEDIAEAESSNLIESKAENEEQEENTFSVEVTEDKKVVESNKSVHVEPEKEAGNVDVSEVIDDTTNEGKEVTDRNKSLHDMHSTDEVIQKAVDEEDRNIEVPILQLEAEQEGYNSSNVKAPEAIKDTITEGKEVTDTNKSAPSGIIYEVDDSDEEVVTEEPIKTILKNTTAEEQALSVEIPSTTTPEFELIESTISNLYKEREDKADLFKKAESKQNISIDLTKPALDIKLTHLNILDEANQSVTTTDETPFEISNDTAHYEEHAKTKPLDINSKLGESVEPSSSKTPIESESLVPPLDKTTGQGSDQNAEQATSSSLTTKPSDDISEVTKVKATEKGNKISEVHEAAPEDQQTKKTTDLEDDLVSKNVLAVDVLVEDAKEEEYKPKHEKETQEGITESVEVQNSKEQESEATTSSGIQLPAKRKGRKPSKQMAEEKKESICISSVPIEETSDEEKTSTNQLVEKQEESGQVEQIEDVDNLQEPTSYERMHEPAKRKGHKPPRSKISEENIESTTKIPYEKLSPVEDNKKPIALTTHADTQITVEASKPDLVVSTSTRKAEIEIYVKASYEVRLSEVIEEASNIKSEEPVSLEPPKTGMNMENIQAEKFELGEEVSGQEITSTTGHIEKVESIHIVSKGEEELHIQRQTRRARKGSQSSQCSAHDEDHLPTTTSTRRRGGRRRAITPVEHSSDEGTASDISKVKRRRGQVQITEEPRLEEIKEVQADGNDFAADEEQITTVELEEVIEVKKIIEDDTQVTIEVNKNIKNGKHIDDNKPQLEESKLQQEEKEETERVTSKRRRVGRIAGELGDGETSSKNSGDPHSDTEVQNLGSIEATSNVPKRKRKQTHSESSQTSNIGENIETHTTQRRRRGRQQTLDEPTAHGTAEMSKANIELINELQENKDVKSKLESVLPPVNETPESESSSATKNFVEDDADALKKEVYSAASETSKHMRTKRPHKPSETPKDHAELKEEINDVKAESNNEEISMKHEEPLSKKITAGRSRVNRRRKSEIEVDKEQVCKMEETDTDPAQSLIVEHDAELPNAVEDSVGGRRGRRGAAAAATVAINEVSSAHKRGALRGKSQHNKTHLDQQAELAKKSVVVEHQVVAEEFKDRAVVEEKIPQNITRKRRGSVAETQLPHTEEGSETTDGTQSSRKITAKRTRKRRESHHIDEPTSPKKSEAKEDAPTSSAPTESPSAAYTKKQSRRKRKDSHQNTDDAMSSRADDEPVKKRLQSLKRRDSSLDSSTHDSASVDVDTNPVGNTSSSSTTPQRSRTIPRRAAAAQDRNYDESSDAEAQVDLKRRIEKASLPKTCSSTTTASSKSSKHKSPTAEVVPTTVIEIATKITGTPVLAAVMTTSRGGRQRKPTARVQQYLEEERAKAETPKKRLLLGSIAGGETPTRATPARRTQKASTIESEAVETVKAAARNRGRHPKTVQVMDISDDSRAHTELDTTHSASHGEEAGPVTTEKTVKSTSRRGKHVTVTPVPCESELSDTPETTAAAPIQVTHTGRVGRAAKAAAAAALITDEPSSSYAKARGGRARRGAHTTIEDEQHPDVLIKDTSSEVETPSAELEKQIKKTKTNADGGRAGRGGRRKQQHNVEQQSLLESDETGASASQTQHHHIIVDADDEHEDDEDAPTHTEEEEAKSETTAKGKKRNATTRKRVATEQSTTATSPPKRGRRRPVATTTDDDDATESIVSGRNRKIVRFDAATPSSAASSTMSVETVAEEVEVASSAPTKRATRSRRK